MHVGLDRLVVFLAAATFTALACGAPAYAEPDCDNAYESPANAALDFSCTAEQVARDCKQWFTDNPETADFARNCKDSNDQGGFDEAFFLKCMSKWGGAWKDQAKAVVNGLVATGQAIRASADALQACDHDLAQKQTLANEAYYVCRDAKGAYQFPCTDPAKLDEVDCFSLLHKRDQVREAALSDGKLRDILKKNNVDVPDLAQHGDGQPPDVWSGLKNIMPASMMVSALINGVHNSQVKFACYNASARAKMLCYTAGEYVDPTMLVGGAALLALKGGKWAVRVLGVGSKLVSAANKALDGARAGKVKGEIIAGADLNPEQKVQLASTIDEAAGEVRAVREGFSAQLASIPAEDRPEVIAKIAEMRRLKTMSDEDIKKALESTSCSI